jgi:recombinational DNA repair protein RecT
MAEENKVAKVNPIRQLLVEVGKAPDVRTAIQHAENRWVTNYNLVTGRKDGHKRFESEFFAYLDIIADKPALQDADKVSHFAAIMKASTTGLSFKNDGHLYPIPQTVNGKKVVKVTIGAHGKREMMRMMQEVKFIHESVVVMKGDKFIHDKRNHIVKIHETTDQSSTRNNIDDVIAAYCTVEWKDGRIIDEVIYVDELKKAKSKSKNKADDSTWNEWPLEMCKKVVYHRVKKAHYRTPEGVEDMGGDAPSNNQDPTEDTNFTDVTSSHGNDAQDQDFSEPAAVEPETVRQEPIIDKGPKAEDDFLK